MDGGVYNRSLFRRKESAREGLSRMGGIMAASPELMAAARETLPPVQTGQGRVLFQAPSIVGAMPGMPMPQPMAPEAMPMQAAPMAQPMPQAEMRFNAGGIVDLGLGAMEAGLQPPPPTFDRPIAPAVTQGQAQGNVTEVLTEIRSTLSDPASDPLTQAEVILEETADQTGVEPTGDTPSDLATAAEQLGIPNAREMRIDQLNRAITGAVIASGTSPSAAENIAAGLLEGLKLQRAEELRRLATDTAQMQALQGGEQGANWFDTPRGKIASKYIETMMGAERDIETIIAELNALDANSPEGARLGDEFRMALSAGAAPPGVTAPALAPEQAMPEEGAQPTDMNALVNDARNLISQVNASNLSPEEKAALTQEITTRFAQAGGNPSLLSAGP